MKGRQIVLGQLFGAEAAALVQDGVLIDLLVDAGLVPPSLAATGTLRGRSDMMGFGTTWVKHGLSNSSHILVPNNWQYTN